MPRRETEHLRCPGTIGASFYRKRTYWVRTSQRWIGWHRGLGTIPQNPSIAPVGPALGATEREEHLCHVMIRLLTTCPLHQVAAKTTQFSILKICSVTIAASASATRHSLSPPHWVPSIWLLSATTPFTTLAIVSERLIYFSNGDIHTLSLLFAAAPATTAMPPPAGKARAPSLLDLCLLVLKEPFTFFQAAVAIVVFEAHFGCNILYVTTTTRERQLPAQPSSHSVFLTPYAFEAD